MLSSVSVLVSGISMKSTAASVGGEIGSFHSGPPFHSYWVAVSILFLLSSLKLLQDFLLSPFFFSLPQLDLAICNKPK